MKVDMRKRIQCLWNVSQIGIPAALLVTMLITASPLDEVRPQLSILLRYLAYGCVFVVALIRVIQSGRTLLELIRTFFRSFGLLLLFPVVIYFLGLVLGAFNGPALASSLKQTISDLTVFSFAYILFGWLEEETDKIVRHTFVSLAVLCTIALLLSYVLYLGNTQGWWWINAYIHPNGRMLMNGIFVHANHLGYFLMIGIFSAGYLALEQKTRLDYRWVIVALFLLSGLLVTFARGAILGTAVGLVGMVAVHYRKIGQCLMATLVGCMLLTGCLFLLWTGDAIKIYQFSPLGQRLSTCDFEWTEEEYNLSWNVIPVEDGGRIVMGSNAAISTDYFISEAGSYVFSMSASGSIGRIHEEDILRTPNISLCVLSGGEVITTRTLQLPEEKAWIEAIEFQSSADQEYEIIIEFADDAYGIVGEDRNVFISELLLYPSDFPLLSLPKPAFVPKLDLGNRSRLFSSAIRNISDYGPLGVGAGNAESLPGLSMHNLFLEQLGEGGVLTLLGFLLWLIIPVARIRKSQLKPALAWSIVAMMAGLLMHGLLWTEFLNGLRILTLFYVCIWIALMTPARIEMNNEKKLLESSDTEKKVLARD